MPIKDRIVAEVTRNWPNSKPNSEDHRFISEKFENAIAVNKKHGYKLENWSMTTVFVPWTAGYDGGVLETIVAVFVKENG